MEGEGEKRIAQNWHWPEKKKKKKTRFGRKPKGWRERRVGRYRDTEIKRASLKKKHFKENKREDEGVRIKWKQEDERERSGRGGKTRRTRRRWKERMVGVKRSSAALRALSNNALGFGFFQLLVLFQKSNCYEFGLRTVCNVSTPSCCVMQSSTVSLVLLVIESRSSPDVTLDDYQLINYCVPPLPMSSLWLK